MISSFTTIRRPTLAVEGALSHSGRFVAQPEVVVIWLTPTFASPVVHPEV